MECEMYSKRKGARMSELKPSPKRFKPQAMKEAVKSEQATLAEQIKSSLKKNKLPEAELLNKLYVEDRSKRNLVEDACKNVACRLEEIKGVMETIFGYRLKDPHTIVFLCIVETDLEIPDEFKGYTIACTHFNEFNKEDNEVLDKERQNSQFISTYSEDFLKVIEDETDSLKKNHRNLIGISCSMLKSKHYEKRGKHTCDDKTCVVLNVKGKGVIPLYEKMLPSQLGPFDTDVRNSYFMRKVGGSPEVLHTDVKIGCKISTDSCSGTLGGFVEHENKTMAITCAHVILDDIELDRIKHNPRRAPRNKCCYQPSSRDSDMIGRLNRATYNKDIDVAFVELAQSRLPTQGVFPDVKNKIECNNPCNHCYGIANKLSYNTGEVLCPQDVTNESVIIKYGYKTGFTRGRIRRQSTFAIFGTHEMQNQIEVVSDDSFPFSEKGDSGSLVLSVDGNKQVKALGILVGGTPRRDFVTPITEILKSIGRQKPYFLKPFDPAMQYLKK